MEIHLQCSTSFRSCRPEYQCDIQFCKPPPFAGPQPPTQQVKTNDNRFVPDHVCVWLQFFQIDTPNHNQMLHTVLDKDHRYGTAQMFCESQKTRLADGSFLLLRRNPALFLQYRIVFLQENSNQIQKSVI